MLSRQKLSLLLLFIVSCGKPKTVPAVNHNNHLAEVNRKSDTYRDGLWRYQDKDGWFYTDKCDASLFTGLLVASGIDVDMTLARDADGMWHRRPDKDCYSGGSNGSTISRDMLVGIMWALYVQGDIESLHYMRRYGKDHNWVMGHGSLDRTFFTPNFQHTLHILTGRTYSGVPYTWVDPVKDHQRHVVALNILLRGEAQGKITDEMLDLLKTFRDKDPANALFQYGVHRYTDGDQSKVLEILLDEEIFPSTGPVGLTCSRWYWEQDEGERSGCAEHEKDINIGGDLVFMTMLLNSSRSMVE